MTESLKSWLSVILHTLMQWVHIDVSDSITVGHCWAQKLEYLIRWVGFDVKENYVLYMGLLGVLWLEVTWNT